jgi:hypothetical protein
MFLAVRCQHVSGTCQSRSHLVLNLREALRKYSELSHSTPSFLALDFHEKDLPPTPRLLQVWPILPPLGHILSYRTLCLLVVAWRCIVMPVPLVVLPTIFNALVVSPTIHPGAAVCIVDVIAIRFVTIAPLVSGVGGNGDGSLTVA